MRDICVSLSEATVEALEGALRGVPFAEIRLDLSGLDESDVARIFSGHPKLIATCRPGRWSAEKRLSLLLRAIESGAAYVDLELETPPDELRKIAAFAREKSCAVIVSFHDFEGTPSREVLEETVARCFGAGADIAKVACFARTTNDAARVLGLLGESRPIVAVGMGPYGKITRIAAPFLGAPFTFASAAAGRETAQGQVPYPRLRALVEEIEHV